MCVHSTAACGANAAHGHGSCAALWTLTNMAHVLKLRSRVVDTQSSMDACADGDSPCLAEHRVTATAVAALLVVRRVLPPAFRPWYAASHLIVRRLFGAALVSLPLACAHNRFSLRLTYAVLQSAARHSAHVKSSPPCIVVIHSKARFPPTWAERYCPMPNGV